MAHSRNYEFIKLWLINYIAQQGNAPHPELWGTQASHFVEFLSLEFLSLEFLSLEFLSLGFLKLLYSKLKRTQANSYHAEIKSV